MKGREPVVLIIDDEVALRRRLAPPPAAPKERHEGTHERPQERARERAQERPKERPKDRQVVGLLSQREALMNEIALRARFGRLPPMFAKAKTLLTNFWARSDWAARAELLPVARMLVVLGAAQPALKPGGREAPTRRRTAGPGPSPGGRRSSQEIAG
jgi:hypothetical protein